MGKGTTNRYQGVSIMQKFLIIQTAFIGDVVLATCLIEKLHFHFPGAQIDFLLRKGNENLLDGHPFLHEILIWDKQKHKRRNLWKMLRMIRKKKYDKVINVQRFTATGFLTAFSGAKETIGFDKNPLSFLFTKRIKHIVSNGKNVKHEIERNNELVKYFTDEKVLKPRLYPSADDEAKVAPYKKTEFITISPASVWFTKQYPREKWIELINSVQSIYAIYLLGSPADFDIADEIRKGTTNTSVINLCGKLSILQSAALMKDAVMNYVNDSAPMHVASAINAPATAIYCSTLPSFGYGPLSDKNFIVEIQEELYCRPCTTHGRRSCPEKHFKCAYDIKVDQLMHALPVAQH